MTALRDWERIVLGVTALDILRERRQRRSDAATQLLLRWISSVRFFESIPASTISTTLVDDLGVEAFAEAEAIYAEGSPHGTVYVVLRGQVRLAQTAPVIDDRAAILGKDDVFGEWWLTTAKTSRSREMSAFGYGGAGCVALTIGEDAVRSWLNQEPHGNNDSAHRCFAHESARRLLKTTKPGSRRPQQLATIAESLCLSNFLSQMPTAFVWKFAQSCALRVFERGDVIAKPGDEPCCLWLVIEGSVNIYLKPSDSTRLSQLPRSLDQAFLFPPSLDCALQERRAQSRARKSASQQRNTSMSGSTKRKTGVVGSQPELLTQEMLLDIGDIVDGDRGAAQPEGSELVKPHSTAAAKDIPADMSTNERCRRLLCHYLDPTAIGCKHVRQAFYEWRESYVVCPGPGRAQTLRSPHGILANVLFEGAAFGQQGLHALLRFEHDLGRFAEQEPPRRRTAVCARSSRLELLEIPKRLFAEYLLPRASHLSFSPCALESRIEVLESAMAVSSNAADGKRFTAEHARLMQRLLRPFPALQRLQESHVNTGMTTERFAKGDLVISAGAPASHVFLLLRGSITMLDDQGKGLADDAAHVKAGGVVGFLPVLMGMPASLCTARASSRALCIAFPRDSFESAWNWDECIDVQPCGDSQGGTIPRPEECARVLKHLHEKMGYSSGRLPSFYHQLRKKTFPRGAHLNAAKMRGACAFVLEGRAELLVTANLDRLINPTDRHDGAPKTTLSSLARVHETTYFGDLGADKALEVKLAALSSSREASPISLILSCETELTTIEMPRKMIEVEKAPFKLIKASLQSVVEHGAALRLNVLAKRKERAQKAVLHKGGAILDTDIRSELSRGLVAMMPKHQREHLLETSNIYSSTHPSGRDARRVTSKKDRPASAVARPSETPTGHHSPPKHLVVESKLAEAAVVMRGSGPSCPRSPKIDQDAHDGVPVPTEQFWKRSSMSLRTDAHGGAALSQESELRSAVAAAIKKHAQTFRRVPVVLGGEATTPRAVSASDSNSQMTRSGTVSVSTTGKALYARDVHTRAAPIQEYLQRFEAKKPKLTRPTSSRTRAPLRNARTVVLMSQKPPATGVL